MTASLSSAQKLLVIAPHPDDDVITSAGIIHAAVARGDDVKVVYMTNGDLFGGATKGYLRQQETVSSVAQLGLTESNLIFLGYPDGALDILHTDYQTPTSVYTSTHGISQTYANRGLGSTDYHNYAFGAHATYNAPNVVADLVRVLETYQPGQIFVTAEEDTHLDHAYSYRFLKDALDQLAATSPAYLPSIYKTLVHVEGEQAPQSGWAEADPQALTPEPPNMNLLPALEWLNRVSVNVAEQLQDPDFFDNLKVRALYSHESQGGQEPQGYLQSFVHKDEFFWVEQAHGTNQPPHVEAGADQTVVAGTTVTLSGAASTDPDGDPLQYSWRQASGPTVQISGADTLSPSFVAPAVTRETILRFELKISDGTFVSATDSLLVTTTPGGSVVVSNIAGQATATASSANTADGQLAARAVDGFVDGYPNDSSKEWSTDGEGEGAWLQLTWPEAKLIEEVVLHDRPNLDDHALAGTLTFGDGTSIPFTALDNLGGGTSIRGFAPVTTDSLRVTFDQVAATTASIGLAEIEVFGRKAPTPNIAALATVSASTQDAGTGQLAIKAVDGVADGYPGDFTKEWATLGEGVGAWLRLKWPSAKLISEVTLFDRPNLDDHALAATLHFGDGTTIPVPALNNAGAATTISGFTPVTTDSLKITFDQVATTTASIGLAEIEVLGTEPPPNPNVAPQATVSASSQNAGTDQLAVKAIDGVADGYPGDYTKEWATLGEGSGAWLKLSWPTAKIIDQVKLFDRPNADDHVLAATLEFGDGTTIPVTALDNGGAAKIIKDFTPVTTDSLKITFDQVATTTASVGLAEVQVLGIDSPTSPNIARTATVTASSQNVGTEQLAVKAIDGVADGYPGDHTKEWATQGEGTGAWLELTWPTAKVIDQVKLFDRPNLNDQVLAATLEFGDGTIVPVTALDNGGAAKTISGFAPVTTDSLRITFDQVAATTSNIGLAEIQVLGTDPQTLLV